MQWFVLLMVCQFTKFKVVMTACFVLPSSTESASVTLILSMNSKQNLEIWKIVIQKMKHSGAGLMA